MALLELSQISKSYGSTPVLRDVSFHAQEGEIVCLLGPSGCGKTTLLRIIAGLEKPDVGTVALGGRSLDEIPVHRRSFGLMFQDYALFPHKDVAANVAFGLRMQTLPQSQIMARVAEMLDLVGLAGYERRRVYDLSGGEQQRVALARSLAPGPRLLMLDEPLGSLDRALREELLGELRLILNRVQVTTLYVTHDQQEAFAVADRVIIMHQGRILQQGTPQAVYHSPATPWVAHFLGLSNLLKGRVVGLDPAQVETDVGCFLLAGVQKVTIGQEVVLLVRPEAARLAADCPGEVDPLFEGTRLEGRVRASSFRGSHYHLVVVHETGIELAFEMRWDRTRTPRPGDTVSLLLRPEAVGLLPGEFNAQTTDL
jgi:ABC-type Fe3+/spermidine/putrescine transport system ATPase subunit